MAKKPQPKIFKLEKLSDDNYLSPQINLALKGFKKQQLISPEEVARFLAVFPQTHLAGLRIIELEKRSFGHMLSRRIGGRFYLKDKRIVIEGFKNREVFFYTLCHELGHFVYYNVIDSYTKKEWVTKLYKSSGFVSAYSQRNGAEDFAECYAHYALQKPNLNAFAAKKAFMRRKVFGHFGLDQDVLDEISTSTHPTTDPDKSLDIRL